MAGHMSEAQQEMAENIRRVLLETALQAYEDAGMSGLCEEGRWEAAISALRSYDLGTIRSPADVADDAPQRTLGRAQQE